MKTLNVFLNLLLLICCTALSSSLYAQWTQMGGDIDGSTAYDNLGWSVSLSSDGHTLAIGAPSGNGQIEGYVRVFEWNGNAWNQKGTDLIGEAIDDGFGRSVSLSSDGNTLAIGAPYNDGNGNSSGHVRIFTWNGTGWIQKGNDIDGEASTDFSGDAVSISADGNTVLIGAPGNNGNGPNSGHVRVFQWNGTDWTQKGNDIDGEAQDDLSGDAVSISADGNTIAIGAPHNDGSNTNAGHVRVYQWNGTNWVQKGNDIDGVGNFTSDRSGQSVSLSSDGNTVAIGAPGYDGVNGYNSGHVRVFHWNGTSWIQKGSSIDGEATNDYSGISVSLSSDGNTVAIGAHYNDGSGSNAGHVRIYEWNGSAWVQKGGDLDGEAPGDWLGWAVSLNAGGDIVAAGAPHNGQNGTDAGHVRVYAFSSLNIPDNDLEADIKISPNPNTGNFSIFLSNKLESVSITIVDLTGKKVFQNVFKDVSKIDLELDLPKGVYVILLKSGDMNKLVKLLIQ